MHKHEIEARQPERQAIADAVAAFKAGGGKVEVHAIQMREYVPAFNRQVQAEIDRHKARERNAKPKPEPAAKPTRYEQEMAAVDKLSAEIDALFERLKSKEKNNDV